MGREGDKQTIRTHQDLEVFQMGFEAAMRIFELAKRFPKEETYSLTDQIRRLSPCRLFTLSPSRPFSLSPCRLFTLSPSHPITSSPCQFVALSPIAGIANCVPALKRRLR